MIKQITKGQLLNFHNELQNLHGSVTEILLESKIHDFEKKYGVRIQSIIDRIQRLEEKYFVIDNPDKPTRKVKYITETVEKEITIKKYFGLVKKKVKQTVPTGKNIPVLLSGMQMKDYEKELFGFLGEPVTSNLMMVTAK
jgi:hypothetical protein